MAWGGLALALVGRFCDRVTALDFDTAQDEVAAELTMLDASNHFYLLRAFVAFHCLTSHTLPIPQSGDQQIRRHSNTEIFLQQWLLLHPG